MSTDEDGMNEPFVAVLDGHDAHRFHTLQGAMAWVESHDDPTGVICCLGIDVMRYDCAAADVHNSDRRQHT